MPTEVNTPKVDGLADIPGLTQAPKTCPKTGGKMTQLQPRFGHGLCGQRHGLAMNWVDRPRTSADKRDVVWAPRCRDCVWAVAEFGLFFVNLSFLREQSP